MHDGEDGAAVTLGAVAGALPGQALVFHGVGQAVVPAAPGTAVKVQHVEGVDPREGKIVLFGCLLKDPDIERDVPSGHDRGLVEQLADIIVNFRPVPGLELPELLAREAVDVAGLTVDAPHGHDDGVEAGGAGRVHDGDLDDLRGLAEPGGLGVEDQDVLAVQELAEGGPGFLLLTQVPAAPAGRLEQPVELLGDPSGPNMGADGDQSIIGRLANQIEVDRSIIPNWRKVLTRPGYVIFKILLRPSVAQVKLGNIVRVILV